MKIYYFNSRYRSHRRVANVYKELIARSYSLVDDPRSADVIFLHLEPHDYGALYSHYPELKTKYVIAYCVWEASDLPETYRRSISYVQEVWTCSTYCWNIFKRHHNQVIYMPHAVVRDLTWTSRDTATVMASIRYEPDAIYYLTITKLWDKRKNADFLIAAFTAQSHRMPRARLIVKATLEDSIPEVCNSKVIVLTQELTESELNALYALAHVYVSAHHSEGWGLPLSDAILFEKPVIATGYSGNLDFMTAEDSLLVSYQEDNIRPEDCFGPFQTHMKWAYPDFDDLKEKLSYTYETYSDPNVKRKNIGAKQRITSRFNLEAVDNRISQRLDIVSRYLPG